MEDGHSLGCPVPGTRPVVAEGPRPGRGVPWSLLLSFCTIESIYVQPGLYTSKPLNQAAYPGRNSYRARVKKRQVEARHPGAATLRVCIAAVGIPTPGYLDTVTGR
eukprot:1129348-Rhodomonas_salina.1